MAMGYDYRPNTSYTGAIFYSPAGFYQSKKSRENMILQGENRCNQSETIGLFFISNPLAFILKIMSKLKISVY